MKKFFSFLLLALFLPAITLAAPTATVAETEDAAVQNVEAELKGILADVFAKVEPWRKQQAEHFAELRDRKKQELGVNGAKDVYDALTPKPPETPAVPGSQQSEQDLADLSNQYQGVDFLGYGTLIYATALATIFASIALFYITAVLLALMVLRFIVRIFR